MIKGAKTVLFSLCLLASTGQAVDMNMSGNFEGGLQIGDIGGTNARFFIDALHMHKSLSINDNTKLVMRSQLGATDASSPAAYTAQDGGAFAGAGVTVAAPLGWNLNAAYLMHSFSDKFSMNVGYVPVGLGMESMGERYDNHSYFYSTAFRSAHTRAFMYDLGVQFNITAFGNLQIGLYDGRQDVGTYASGFPAMSAMWHNDFEAGKMTFTPVAYIYGNFGAAAGTAGSDLHFGGGLKWKMGMIWANVEYLSLGYGTSNATAATTDTSSIIIEPGVNIGDLGFSAKVDLANVGGASGVDFGFALSNTYDKFRIKAVAMIMNATTNTSGFDARVMFGTNW